MGTSLWPLCRLSLIVTFLWMFLASLAMIGESHGAKILSMHSETISLFAAEPTSDSCAAHIDHHENKHRIPTGLLHAISKVESGKKGPTGHLIAWPWTVNAGGKGQFFSTKEAAIAAVHQLQNKGISNIDVGCMQVNLHHHPKAFRNLHDAFEPAKNVAYAAQFLKALKNTHSSWHQAIAHYHSANPIYNIPYRQTVMGAWNRNMKMGSGSVALASFHTTSPQRLHRLGKTLSLTQASFHRSSSKAGVRRVVASHSPHIHRVSGRKTLKLL